MSEQKKITIVTWNVNSIKARLPNVLTWLKSAKPDIVLLQELKCVEEAFPKMEIEELGYNLAIHGQKTYNGVAILSKFPIDDVTRNIPGFEDEAARYIECVVSLPGSALRVASVYVPNGQAVGSDKFQYKMNFYDKLYDHLKNIRNYDEMISIGGDFNCAPEDIDVYDAKSLHGSICFNEQEQFKFRKIINLGYIDIYRAVYPQRQQFSWWDYRAGAFDHNHGMRIDHILVNPKAADAFDFCEIDIEPRGQDKASDHTPVVARIAV